MTQAIKHIRLLKKITILTNHLFINLFLCLNENILNQWVSYDQISSHHITSSYRKKLICSMIGNFFFFIFNFFYLIDNHFYIFENYIKIQMPTEESIIKTKIDLSQIGLKKKTFNKVWFLWRYLKALYMCLFYSFYSTEHWIYLDQCYVITYKITF